MPKARDCRNRRLERPNARSAVQVLGTVVSDTDAVEDSKRLASPRVLCFNLSSRVSRLTCKAQIMSVSADLHENDLRRP